MYSKQALRDLRDTMIQERNADRYVSTRHGRTARHLCEVLMLHSCPEAIEKALREMAAPSRNDRIDEDHETDFALAYDILYGDIDLAPLHIDDALASVAAWRLKQPGQLTTVSEA